MSTVAYVTCCSFKAARTLTMPATATITANSPSSPKPAASHVVGKIQSRPSAEPGAASCMSVIATMSIAGTTATHPNATRFHGITSVAPVRTKMITTPVKNMTTSPVNGPIAMRMPSTNTTEPRSSWLRVAARARVRSAKSSRSQPVRCLTRREALCE